MSEDLGHVIPVSYLDVDIFYGLCLEFLKNSGRHGLPNDDDEVITSVSAFEEGSSLVLNVVNDVSIVSNDEWTVTPHGLAMRSSGLADRKSFLVRLSQIASRCKFLAVRSRLSGNGNIRQYVLECVFSPIQATEPGGKLFAVSMVKQER